MRRYAIAQKRERFRLAAENPRKTALVEELVQTNPDEQILAIGVYLRQLESKKSTRGEALAQQAQEA